MRIARAMVAAGVLAVLPATAMLASPVPAAPAAPAAPPKKTECATANPTWVTQGIKVMQTLGPVGAPGQITNEFFSLEVAPEITTPVNLNPGGYQRLWDLGVDWADVNPAPGVFDWSVLDVRVKQVTDSGAKAMYVLGMTPQWAALNPAAGDPRWGAGTASMPKDMETWRAYVRAVAERYNGSNGFGTIAAFEVWNEANLATFWDNGDVTDLFGMNALGEMTKIAYDTINQVNPNAVVIAATTTTRVRGANDNFGGPQLRYWYYLEALKRNGWPFDAWGIHSYPAGNAGPTQRIADVTCWQEMVVRNLGETEVTDQVKANRAGKPTLLGRPIFDTEMNFGFAGPGATPGALYNNDQSERLVWRAYIDSARLGIDSTTWYLYSQSTYTIGGTPMGVQMFSGQPAIGAYAQARTMLVGQQPFKGCGNIGVGVTPTVKSCELGALRDPTLYTQGSILGTGFLVFAEDVFAGPTKTVPFIAAFTVPLAPRGPVTTAQTYTEISGAPLLVVDIRGLRDPL